MDDPRLLGVDIHNLFHDPDRWARTWCGRLQSILVDMTKVDPCFELGNVLATVRRHLDGMVTPNSAALACVAFVYLFEILAEDGWCNVLGVSIPGSKGEDTRLRIPGVWGQRSGGQAALRHLAPADLQILNATERLGLGAFAGFAEGLSLVEWVMHGEGGEDGRYLQPHHANNCKVSQLVERGVKLKAVLLVRFDQPDLPPPPGTAAGAAQVTVAHTFEKELKAAMRGAVHRLGDRYITGHFLDYAEGVAASMSRSLEVWAPAFVEAHSRSVPEEERTEFKEALEAIAAEVRCLAAGSDGVNLGSGLSEMAFVFGTNEANVANENELGAELESCLRDLGTGGLDACTRSRPDKTAVAWMQQHARHQVKFLDSNTDLVMALNDGAEGCAAGARLIWSEEDQRNLAVADYEALAASDSEMDG